MTSQRTYASVVINATTHDETETATGGYCSGVTIFTNSKNKESIICSPMMERINIKNETQNELIDKIRSVDAMMCFSCRAIDKCMYDQVSSKEKEDENVYQRYLKGYTMIYPEYTGRGCIIYNKKNELLTYFNDLEFMISNGVIPYAYICKNRDERAKMFSNLNVKRSDGSTNKAILSLDNGLIVQKNKNKILLRIQYNNKDYDNMDMAYKLKSYGDYTTWMEPYTEMFKHITIEDFIKANPSFCFDFRIDNPLTTHQEIYDKYVKGDEELEKQYEELNSYYYQKITKFFQEDVIPLLKKIEKNTTVQIY